MVNNARKVLILLMLSCSMLLSAAKFTPYIPTEVEETEIKEVGVVLQNYNSPKGEDEVFYDYMDRAEASYKAELDLEGSGTYLCAYCMEREKAGGDYFDCLQDVYDMGVVPVKENGKVVRYEFPYCEDENCPIHHKLGFAAKSDGSVSDVEGIALGDEIQKPLLPVGEPFVMLFFLSVYSVFRYKKAIKIKNNK